MSSPEEGEFLNDLPIDLSRHRYERRHEIPPLIPISDMAIKKRWHAATEPERYPHAFVPVPQNLMVTKKRRLAELYASTDHARGSMPKTARDEDWNDLRLDRANSVPYIKTLPPLLRFKSLSESRIAPTVSYTGTEVRAHTPVLPTEHTSDMHPLPWMVEHEQEIQRQRLQQVQLDLVQLPTETVPEEDSETDAAEDMSNPGYYTHILQCYQAQQRIRNVTVQQLPPPEEQPQKMTLSIPTSTPDKGNVTFEPTHNQLSDGMDEPLSTDDTDAKRRPNRPLTGRHVRTGTGASPATLLTLRRKIQARQKKATATSSK